METIKNKVAESGILSLDLAPFIPEENDLIAFDLKPFLFMEMILKEKDYRAALQLHDWEQYRNKHVGIICSVDAIIPMWAFMLAATNLEPFAKSIHFGTLEAVKNELISKRIGQIDKDIYFDKRVVVKGCGDVSVPEAAYVAIAALLRPVAKSIMYGEPCSTVPIYKKPMVKTTSELE